MTSPSAGGNGQAPTSSPAAPAATGQAPTPAPAHNSTAGTPASGAPNGQAPTATPQSPSQQGYTAPDEQTWRRAQQELDEARREAAKARTELKTRDDATLTAQQKLERDYAETQAAHLELQARYQRSQLENAVYRLAPSLGITDAGAALASLYFEHEAEIELDETTGAPKHLDTLLKKVLADHPLYAGQPGAQNGAQQQRPAANSGGPTNPGAAARTGTWTREQINRMSPEEYAQNRTAIMQAMHRGEIR